MSDVGRIGTATCTNPKCGYSFPSNYNGPGTAPTCPKCGSPANLTLRRTDRTRLLKQKKASIPISPDNPGKIITY